MTAEGFLRKGSAVNQIAAVKEYSGSEGPFDSLVQTLRNGPDDFDGKYWGTRQAVPEMEQKQRGGAIQAVRDFVKTLPSFATARSMGDFAGNTGFLEKVSRSPNPGGLFISHHLVSDDGDTLLLPFCLVELMTRSMGYPALQLPEGDLKAAWARVGFKEFQKRRPYALYPDPVLLLSVVKQDGESGKTRGREEGDRI